MNKNRQRRNKFYYEKLSQEKLSQEKLSQEKLSQEKFKNALKALSMPPIKMIKRVRRKCN